MDGRACANTKERARENPLRHREKEETAAYGANMACNV